MSEEVLYEVSNKVATITINRIEKYNALNRTVRESMITLFKKANEDESVRVIVITGAGEKAFISGADIAAFVGVDSQSVRPGIKLGRSVIECMDSIPKPIIAAVNGYALGGGCEIAMACDIRYASANAKLGLPEINLGVLPGNGGTARLPRLVGLGIAKELILTGSMITAEEALRIGLVNKVFDTQDELKAGVSELATRLCNLPGVAIGLAKQSIDKTWHVPLKEQLAFEFEAFCQTFDTEDKKEGVAAFLEKRKPEFKHR